MKALIVIDMQNDFLRGSLGNDHCKAAIPKVKALIENGKYDVAFATKDTHTSDYFLTLEGEKLPIEHCQKDTFGWEFADELVGAIENKKVMGVVKPTFGSFELPTAILDFYKNRYGEQAAKCLGRGRDLEIHVCGVCTSICVLANVVILRATWPDAAIVVHADACGDVTKEMHEAAKVCFRSQQCEVVGED